jgi:hypothetical protein
MVQSNSSFGLAAFSGDGFELIPGNINPAWIETLVHPLSQALFHPLNDAFPLLVAKGSQRLRMFRQLNQDRR